MRTETIVRNTKETQIALTLALDGNGAFNSKVDCGFLSHMLELFAFHGRFDLNLTATGDTHVDLHHLTEDLGIALGRAVSGALGERVGINRYGNFLMPMDESLVIVGLDIGGRSFLGYDVSIPTEKVGDFDTQLVEEFFLGFVRGLGCCLHFKQFAGNNSHHIIEGIFKGFARALKEAVKVNPEFKGEVTSSKGTIL